MKYVFWVGGSLLAGGFALLKMHNYIAGKLVDATNEAREREKETRRCEAVNLAKIV